MPVVASAEDDELPTETAVLLLWQQVLAPARRVSTCCLGGVWHLTVTRTAIWSGLPTRYGTTTSPAARQAEQCWTRPRHFEFHQICLMRQVGPVWLQATVYCMLAALSAATVLCALVD